MPSAGVCICIAGCTIYVLLVCIAIVVQLGPPCSTAATCLAGGKRLTTGAACCVSISSGTVPAHVLH